MLDKVQNSEIKKQSEALRMQSDNGSLDKDIKCLQRQLKDYDNQEERLVKALQFGAFTENVVLDSINQLKNDRQSTVKS